MIPNSVFRGTDKQLGANSTKADRFGEEIGIIKVSSTCACFPYLCFQQLLVVNRYVCI